MSRRAATVSANPTAGGGDRYMTSDRIALRVQDTGPRDALVTVILLHGWTLDHTSWDAVWQRLAPAAEKVRVIRYDHRGHGSSAAAPPGTATIARLADDLAEVIADLVPDGPVVLTGHSMGGMTIMALAERNPELVRQRIAGVAFVATSSGELLSGLPRALPRRVSPPAPQSARLINRVAVSREPATSVLRRGALRVLLRPLLYGRHARRDDIDQTVRQILRAHPGSVLGFQESLIDHDRRMALPIFGQIPVVVLAGGLDRLCSTRHSHTIVQALPTADFVLYPQAGHMLPNERPDEVADRIVGLVSAATRR